MIKVNLFVFFNLTVILSFLVLGSFSFSIHALEFGHKTMWGEKGVSQGQFNQPGGVAVDSDNNVYVSDTSGYSTRMIQQFSPNGTFVNGFGTFGNGPQYFAGPSGLAWL